MLDDIPITEARHGVCPVLAVMPWDLYESIMETLNILEDEELMVALRQGIQEAEAGQGIPWEQARQQLDL
jgi:antitoxin YefM